MALDDLVTDVLATVVFDNRKVVLLGNTAEVVSGSSKVVVSANVGAAAEGLAGIVLMTTAEVLPDANVSEASVFAGAAGFRAERII